MVVMQSCLAGEAGQLAIVFFGIIISIKLHCIGYLSHGSKEQEQWDVKINVW